MLYDMLTSLPTGLLAARAYSQGKHEVVCWVEVIFTGISGRAEGI